LPHAYYSIKWNRPEHYIRERLLDNELRFRMPNRNILKLRYKIRQLYYGEKEQVSNTILKTIQSKWTHQIKTFQSVKEEDIALTPNELEDGN